jgi:hypothetical protein
MTKANLTGNYKESLELMMIALKEKKFGNKSKGRLSL